MNDRRNGAVAMEIPTDLNDLSTFVYSAHVAVIICANDNVPEYRLHDFGFSKPGSRALPLWDGEGGGTKRLSVLEDGRKSMFE